MFLASQHPRGTDFMSTHRVILFSESGFLAFVSFFIYMNQFVPLLAPQTQPDIYEHAHQRYEGEALSP